MPVRYYYFHDVQCFSVMVRMNTNLHEMHRINDLAIQVTVAIRCSEVTMYHVSFNRQRIDSGTRRRTKISDLTKKIMELAEQRKARMSFMPPLVIFTSSHQLHILATNETYNSAATQREREQKLKTKSQERGKQIQM